jgi:ABC-2 type transport system ATP-binding protein
MNENLAIEATGLIKRFGSFTAVDSLDLYVEAGTVVSLLGPNGAGKTTTAAPRASPATTLSPKPPGSAA